MNLTADLALLEAAGLIRATAFQPELEYVFRHVLVQEVVYTSLLMHDRSQLHLLIGETLERQSPERLFELAPRLAEHFLHGGDQQRALHYFTIAGDTAFEAYANAEAARHYGQAIRVARKMLQPDRERPLQHLYLRRGRALEISGRYEEALQNYQELEQLALERHNQSLALAARMALATVYATFTPVHDPEHGAALARAALELAQELGDPEAEAKSLWNLMLVDWSAGNPVKAISYGHQSLEITRRHSLREQTAFTLNNLAWAYLDSGQVAEARALALEANELWGNLGNQTMLVDNLNMLCWLEFWSGALEPAVQLCQRGLDIAYETDNLWGVGSIQLVLAHTRLEQAMFYQTLECAREVIKVTVRIGLGQIEALGHALAAWSYAFLGAPALARAELDRALARGDELKTSLRPWLDGICTQAALLLGDRDRLANFLMTGLENFKGQEGLLVSPAALILPLSRSQLALMEGDYEAAALGIRDLLDFMDGGGFRAYRPDALLCQGQALLRLGQREAAWVALSAARTEARRQGAWRSLWMVEAELWRSRVLMEDLLEFGDPRSAARSLTEKIAASISDDELRKSFLASPPASSILSL